MMWPRRLTEGPTHQVVEACHWKMQNRKACSSALKNHKEDIN